jgi:hypothetical protein
MSNMKPLTFSAVKYTSKETNTAKKNNPKEFMETLSPISTMNRSTRNGIPVWRGDSVIIKCGKILL